MRLAAVVAIAVLTARLWAGEPQVIDDFENGVSGWYLVEGTKPEGAPPLCTMVATADAEVGAGAARLRFQACPDTWTHMQLNIAAADWIVNDCDRIGFWLKGDGSGERLTVMFGNYGLKPALCFRYPVLLDFTGWRQFTVPFEDFEPKGQMGARVGQLVLAQLNVQATQKPVDVVVDELVALPAERGAGKGRFFDLSIVPKGGWSDRGPAEAVRVDNLKSLPDGVVLSSLVHGTRNHPDLHNPVSFLARYPDDGTFGVKVGTTSGYGGSRLVIRLDDEEVLRRDFPGETETALTDYTGYYWVPVPAGEHRITVDNDGNDWLTVDAYRFGNFQTAGARVRREDQRVAVTLLDAQGKALPGVEVRGDVAGLPLRFARQPDGTYLSDSPAGRFPVGSYPITVVARRAGEVVFTDTKLVRLGAARMRPLRVVHPTGQAVEYLLRCTNQADVPLEGKTLDVVLEGRRVRCRDGGEGVYAAALGVLPAGAYHPSIEVQDGPTFSMPLLVRDPAAKPWEREGLARLGRNGWFETADGRPYVPWGYATIGLFTPDPELIVGLAGASHWCRASDEDILNWIGLLAAYGVNCVRFGVNVDSRSIGGDQGGHADPFILAQLRRFLDLIGPLGVRAVPVLWWGHYRNFSFQGIPAYDALIEKQADWFTNAQALELQRQYTREVVEPFRDDPRILAWEVMNETYSAGGDLAASVAWTNEIARTIRSVSPTHLVTTSAAEATPGPQQQWLAGADVDFFNYHAYPSYPSYDSYNKLAGDSPRELGNYVTVMSLCAGLKPRPSILGEAGNDRMREASYPELRQIITRDCLWLAFLHGSPGGISWDAIADPREFYVLSQITRAVDWRDFEPAPAPMAVTVSNTDAKLPNLAQYTWWSLQTGVPVTFVPPGAPAAPGQALVPGDRFAPPEHAPPAPASVSDGWQAASLTSRDGRVLIAYVRNVGDVPRINTRTRSPAPLRLTVRPRRPGTLAIWDLDTRQVVREVAVKGETHLDLGETAHDFAVVLKP